MQRQVQQQNVRQLPVQRNPVNTSAGRSTQPTPKQPNQP